MALIGRYLGQIGSGEVGAGCLVETGGGVTGAHEVLAVGATVAGGAEAAEGIHTVDARPAE